MDLKGKYLKYNESITEEVFDKIILTVEKAGMERTGSDPDFEGFKKHDALYFFSEGKYWSSARWGGECIPDQIQVSDILGEGWDKVTTPTPMDKEWWKELKKGDYVVCTEKYKTAAKANFIYLVLIGYKGADTHCFFYSKHQSPMKDNMKYWRKATSDEIKLYEDAGEPVDVTTYVIPVEESTDDLAIDSWCVQITEENREVVKRWCGREWEYTIGAHYGMINKEKDAYRNRGEFDTLLTTEQFYEKIGHVVEKEEDYDFVSGEWLTLTKDYLPLMAGESYRFIKYQSDTKAYSILWHNSTKQSSYSAPLSSELRRSTDKEIALAEGNLSEVKDTPPEALKEVSNEELLEKAKRDYPVGTEYYAVHLDNTPGTKCKVRNTSNFYWKGEYLKESDGNIANGHGFSETIFKQSKNKWATIISKPELKEPEVIEEIPAPKFKVGDEVRECGGGNEWLVGGDIECDAALNYESTDRPGIFPIKSISFSKRHSVYFYTVSGFANMITEPALKLAKQAKTSSTKGFKDYNEFYEEAKRRGYIGAKVRCLDEFTRIGEVNEEVTVLGGNANLYQWMKGSGVHMAIYKKETGEWAEIIEPAKGNVLAYSDNHRDLIWAVPSESKFYGEEKEGVLDDSTGFKINKSNNPNIPLPKSSNIPTLDKRSQVVNIPTRRKEFKL
jgi:hypothetical protein